jgi:CHAD domain-containing protein
MTTDSLPASAPARKRGNGPLSAGEVVLGYVDARLAELARLEAAVRDAEPDSVHRTRVAARRIRSVLQVFRPLLREAGPEPIISELRWLGQELGAARVVEVLRDHLLVALDQPPAEAVLGPVRARVVGHFAPDSAAAGQRVRELSDSPRFRRLLGALEAFIAAPPPAPEAVEDAAEILPHFVDRAQRRAGHRMRWVRHVGSEERDPALHEARKAVRRARHAAEAVSPASGRRPRKSVKALKRLQSTLGAHHDAVAAGPAPRLLAIRAFEWHQADRHRKRAWPAAG